ncbi:MAG: hypothetical protein C4K58_00340 [Flavobacteriaceae bacterium]|nr:MAG: hypothetical protein C4K58_00340 [Flavobacteriaceae bacterium]
MVKISLLVVKHNPLLFVYGTLLQKSENKWSKLLQENSKPIGKGHFHGELFDLGQYPGAKISLDSTQKVYGEIFEINSPEILLELDHYEGDQYTRDEVKIYTEDQIITAFVYLLKGQMDSFPKIQSGNYIDFLKRQNPKSILSQYGENKKRHHSLELIVLADGVRTPANLGMIFRICEAFSVKKVLLYNCPAWQSIKTKRAAKSTEKYLDIRWVEDLAPTLFDLNAQGYTLLGLELTKQSLPIKEFVLKSSKIVLCVGSERSGLGEELLDLCTNYVYLPLFGHNHSINVSQALGIALWEFTGRK